MNSINRGLLKNLLFSIMIFVIILFQKSISKAVVISGFFMILTSVVLIKMKDYNNMLFYMFAIFLTMSVKVYIKDVPTGIYTAGANVGTIITIYDVLIIIYILNNIRRFKDSSKIVYKFVPILSVLFLILEIATYKYALNKTATVNEILRIAKFILFSLVITKTFDYEKYKSFVTGLGHVVILQLCLGVLQIVKGGALGLGIFGEATRVFREGVSGLEKGMSGTIGHPGTMAIFTLFCLCNFLFMQKSKEKVIFIMAAIFTIILTFARTSIVLMICEIFGFFLIKIFRKELKFNITYKKIMISIFLIIFVSLSLFIIRDKVIVLINRFTESDFSEQVEGRGEHTEVAETVYKIKGNWANGANNYVYTVKSVFPIEARNYFNYMYPVHNLYALYLVEIGKVGVALYVLLYLSIPLSIFKKFNINDEEKIKNNAIIDAGFLWIFTILVFNFTGWSGAKDILMLLMWLSIGFSQGSINKCKNIEMNCSKK